MPLIKKQLPLTMTSSKVEEIIQAPLILWPVFFTCHEALLWCWPSHTRKSAITQRSNSFIMDRMVKKKREYLLIQQYENKWLLNKLQDVSTSLFYNVSLLASWMQYVLMNMSKLSPFWLRRLSDFVRANVAHHFQLSTCITWFEYKVKYLQPIGGREYR